MNWNDAIYGLGDFFWYTFELLPKLGNGFNYLIIVVGTIMILWWISQLVKFANQAADKTME